MGFSTTYPFSSRLLVSIAVALWAIFLSVIITGTVLFLSSEKILNEVRTQIRPWGEMPYYNLEDQSERSKGLTRPKR
jgi:ABC-type phosphate/phosphonate transport system permease subunit